MLVWIGSLALDCAEVEAHGRETEITDHPVSKGVNFSDHKRQKPKKLTIQGIVTETPIGESEDMQRSAADSAGQDFDPSLNTQAAMDALEAMDGSPELLTVVTSLGTYTDMGIEAIDVPRDGKTGAALRFTIKLKQVRVVENKLIVVPKTKIRHALVHTGLASAASGSATLTPARNSALYDGGTAIFGADGAAANAKGKGNDIINKMISRPGRVR